jgi:hypothetical protein
MTDPWCWFFYANMTGVYWWDPWHTIKIAAPLGSFGADHGNRKPTWQPVQGGPVFHIMRTQRKKGLPSDKWRSMITSMITWMTINVNFQWGYLSMCYSPKTPQSWFLGFSWATFDALKDLMGHKGSASSTLCRICSPDVFPRFRDWEYMGRWTSMVERWCQQSTWILLYI